MKRSLRISSLPLLFLTLLALWPQAAHAQFGVAAAYGSDTELGVQASFYVPLGLGGLEGLRAGGDVTFYVPTDAGAGIIDLTYTYFEGNANGQYALQENDRMRLYALGGLNYSYLSVSGATGFGNVAASGGDVGLNLGGGAEFGAGFAGLFAEAKFTLGGFSQLGLLVGARFGGR